MHNDVRRRRPLLGIIFGIILWLLKAIGILLIGLVLLVMSLILIILFVPIRYFAEGTYEEQLSAKFKVSWLFGAFHGKGSVEGSQVTYKVGVLFKTLAASAPIVAHESTGTETETEVKPKVNFVKIKEQVKKVWTFLKDEENEGLLPFIFKQIGKLLKKMLPKKLNIQCHFGFEDPATTGIVLGFASVFHGLTYKQLKLLPDFQEKVLEGSVLVKSKIRMIWFVWFAVRLIWDRRVRHAIKDLR